MFRFFKQSVARYGIPTALAALTVGTSILAVQNGKKKENELKRKEEECKAKGCNPVKVSEMDFLLDDYFTRLVSEEIDDDSQRADTLKPG